MEFSQIKSFIRQTLGCGCPDAVFEKIEIDQLEHEAFDDYCFRIVVGDTLLIYMVVTDPDLFDFGQSRDLLKFGYKDRNNNHYNRFRLVLPMPVDENLVNSLTNKLSELFPNDEKIHIHFVKSEEINRLALGKE